MKKLLIVENSLGGGGAEKVLLTLLNAFPRDQYQIDLLLIKGKGIYLNQVPRHVRLMTMLDPAKENASFPMDPCTLREYCTEKLSSSMKNIDSTPILI